MGLRRLLVSISIFFAGRLRSLQVDSPSSWSYQPPQRKFGEAFQAPLPSGWSEHLDPEGRVYFFSQAGSMSSGLSGSFLPSCVNGSCTYAHSYPLPVITMTTLKALITSGRGYAAEQLVPSDGATWGGGCVFLLEVQYSILKSLISTCVLSYIGSREDSLLSREYWLFDRVCES